MKYISCFSGVGGLESSEAPIAYCEIDEDCRLVLARRFNDATAYEDVSTFNPPGSDVVVGGWPCQDISVAGGQEGLSGPRSKLFYELVRVAVNSGAHTIVAENVPNLLLMNSGAEFRAVLQEFTNLGYSQVAWRTLNARQFGLPHERRRVLMVASKHIEVARVLHRAIPLCSNRPRARTKVAGFYWTAGLQSINYNFGYVPTLKVGSSLGIPSPPAVHYKETVRKLSPQETLLLQGFNPSHFDGISHSSIYRMAGNAVAVPVGRFVLDSVANPVDVDIEIAGQSDMFDSGLDLSQPIPKSGLWDGESLNAVIESTGADLAINLADFVDLKSKDSLSPRAAAGFLKRVEKSGVRCPQELLDCIRRIAAQES